MGGKSEQITKKEVIKMDNIQKAISLCEDATLLITEMGYAIDCVQDYLQIDNIAHLMSKLTQMEDKAHTIMPKIDELLIRIKEYKEVSKTSRRTKNAGGFRNGNKRTRKNEQRIG